MQGRIVVLGTGGTIAGAAADPLDATGYRAGQVGVEQLVARVPTLASAGLLTEQLAQVDSKDMDWPLWQQLARRCAQLLADPGVAALLVTHGTDTVEETAWFLHRVLAPRKPLVLACAMRPATALVPDGPQNLLDAVAVARHGLAGVSVVCAGVVHAAMDVRKVHPYRLDAFDSGETGPLGYVEEGRVREVRRASAGEPAPGLLDQVLRTAQAPWVEIVLNHAGAGRAGVDALVAAGVRGLVAAGTGNGTLHQSLEQGLLDAAARGVRVVRTTRCTQGQVIPHPADQLPAYPLSPVKARIDLQLDLLG